MPVSNGHDDEDGRSPLEEALETAVRDSQNYQPQNNDSLLHNISEILRYIRIINDATYLITTILDSLTSSQNERLI